MMKWPDMEHNLEREILVLSGTLFPIFLTQQVSEYDMTLCCLEGRSAIVFNRFPCF